MDLGGQALIEGVLIKSKEKIAIAIRKKGKIETKIDPTPNFSKKFSKIPFIRGIIVLIETLYLGIKYLNYSAEQQLEKEEKISKLETIFSISLSLVISIALFVIAPLVISKFLAKDRILFSIIDGILRIVIFILFLFIISLSKDIKRTFQYHGAEHKAVYCYENGKKLTVENAKRFSRLHARCGTSFLFIVLIVSILLFSALPSAVAYAYPAFAKMNFLAKRAVLVSLRILMIPVIAAVGYELLKLGAKFERNFFVRILLMPGLFVQRLTTREPSSKQIEVAIRALKEILRLEKASRG